MNLNLQNPRMFCLLAVVGAVAMAWKIGGGGRTEALRRLGERVDSRARWRRLVRPAGVAVALVLVVAALARPGWRSHPEPLAGQGHDVVFVIDVSRSMLARDCQPDRLAVARLAIGDLVDQLGPGDRVGLVGFAGSSTILCPLTGDREFFRRVLEKAGPGSVARGGTRIGDALQKTADQVLGDTNRLGFEDAILLTDGGDQGSEIAKAVQALNRERAALLVIGLGSTAQGARIPDGDGFIVYRGREVWTRQEATGLEQMARESSLGLYLDAGTNPVDLPDVYRRFMAHVSETRATGRVAARPEEEFPWFLGLALLILLATGGGLRNPGRTAAAAVLAIAVAAGPTRGAGQSVEEADAERYLAAARTAAAPKDQARELFNAATCWLSAARRVEPASSELAASLLGRCVPVYEAALRVEPDFPEAARNLEIARARWRRALLAQRTTSPADRSAQSKSSDLNRKPTPSPETSRTVSPDRKQPAPNVSPEDILREESEGNRLRVGPDIPKHEPGEEDW